MSKDPNRLTTGIAGLDEILCGGLIPGQTYLVQGGPGSGKTTLGLHFLAAGARNGEKTLYITFGEPATQIRSHAEILGFSIEDICFLDLSPEADLFAETKSYDIFSPSEVEREPITQAIIEQIDILKPKKICVDSITQFRCLFSDNFQFRKQVLSFSRFLGKNQITALFLSEESDNHPDSELQFLCDGVISLNHLSWGRNLAIIKFRSSDFIGGYHSVRLTDKGIVVSPRLQPEIFQKEFDQQKVMSSGITELDELLHGGLECGTITLLTGSTGVGKTTLGLQFMKESAARGERCVFYTFEEMQKTVIQRAEAVNIPVQAMIDLGNLSIVQIEPLHYSPDEFANLVRIEVEERNARLIMLDSISGYRLSLRGEDLVNKLHAVCKYMQNMGITVILVNEMEYVTGAFRVTEIGISYMSDNIIFFRYLEIDGEMRKAIGVLKKRLSDFEKHLREIEITRYGFKVGKPLKALRGIFSGRPKWTKTEEG